MPTRYLGRVSNRVSVVLGGRRRNRVLLDVLDTSQRGPVISFGITIARHCETKSKIEGEEKEGKKINSQLRGTTA